MRDPLLQRVVDKYLIRLASVEACRSGGVRLASQGLTPDVVAAFAEHFYLPQHAGRVAFGGMVRRLKQLVEGFKRAPGLWGRFKKAIGVESLSDIPRAIKDLAALAKKTVRKVLHTLFDTWPLRLYTLEKGKLPGLNALLDRIISTSPKLKAMVSQAVGKVGHFGEMVRKKAPHVVGAAMVAVYIWVWLNVVEFEWDMKSLVDAVSGALTFPDFLASLPGSAFGALLNVFGFGTFTLLPATVLARLMFFISHRYLVWDGRWFKVEWGQLSEDFGVEPAAVGAT